MKMNLSRAHGRAKYFNSKRDERGKSRGKRYLLSLTIPFNISVWYSAEFKYPARVKEWHNSSGGKEMTETRGKRYLNWPKLSPRGMLILLRLWGAIFEIKDGSSRYGERGENTKKLDYKFKNPQLLSIKNLHRNTKFECPRSKNKRNESLRINW